MVITQSRLKEVLDYNQDTGLFTWIRICPGIKRNVPAGTFAQNGYIRIAVDRKLYSAHRLAWLFIYGVMPEEIDHKDGNRSNNRITNLRIATRSQNIMNARIKSNNSSGYKGVSFHKLTRRWRACIIVNKQQLTLGYFDSKEEAAIAYKEAARKYFGEFARIE